MRFFRIVVRRLRSLILRDRVESELEREVSLHLDRLTHEYMDAGMTEAEARLAARREFGAPEQTKQECRDVRRVAWMEDLANDLGYAWRSLLRSPAFAIAAILTIALGIGVNT